VLVREPIAEAAIALLRERFEVDVDGQSDLAERIADYDAIVIRSATKLGDPAEGDRAGGCRSRQRGRRGRDPAGDRRRERARVDGRLRG
jgi:hypothetical protein